MVGMGGTNCPSSMCPGMTVLMYVGTSEPTGRTQMHLHVMMNSSVDGLVSVTLLDEKVTQREPGT